MVRRRYMKESVNRNFMPSKRQRLRNITLESFPIYRCGTHLNLLRKENFHSSARSCLNFILQRGLFFTTQKGMALEYRDIVEFDETVPKKRTGRKGKKIDREERKEYPKYKERTEDEDSRYSPMNNIKVHRPQLLTVMSGLFLQTLQKKNLDIILLSHRDLNTFQKIRTGIIEDETEIQTFFAKKMYPAREIKLTYLRKMAEIIVLIPEGMNSIGFKRANIKHVKPLGRFQNDNGHFHEKVRVGYLWEELCELYHTKKKQLKRLRKQRDNIIFAMAKNKDDIQQAQALKESEIKIAEESLLLKLELYRLREECYQHGTIKQIGIGGVYTDLYPETEAEVQLVEELDENDEFSEMGWFKPRVKYQTMDEDEDFEDEYDHADEEETISWEDEAQEDSDEYDDFEDEDIDFIDDDLYEEDSEFDPEPFILGPFWEKINHYWEFEMTE